MAYYIVTTGTEVVYTGSDRGLADDAYYSRLLDNAGVAMWADGKRLAVSAQPAFYTGFVQSGGRI